MAASKLFLALSLIWGVASSAPSSDITSAQCGIERISQWPEDKKDNELIWKSNENADGTGPLYRLFTEVDVRKVEPGQEYQMTLQSLVDGVHLKRFLVSAESKEGGQCSYGMLRSISDATQHMSYNCPRYLVERSHDFNGLDKISFNWQAPECGCTIIRVQVLDGKDEIFTENDDRFHALAIEACAPKDEDEDVESNDIFDDIDELAQADQPMGEAEAAAEKQGKKAGGSNNQSKQARKKTQKAKGKLSCCKYGIQALKVSNNDLAVCDKAAPEDLLVRTTTDFELPGAKCAEVYSICCKDKTKLKKHKKQVKKAKGKEQNQKKNSGNSVGAE